MADLTADGDLQTVLKRLTMNGFKAMIAPDAKTALKLVLDAIPQEAVVGFGDSLTVRGLGVQRELTNRGTKLVDPIVREAPLPSAAVDAAGAVKQYEGVARKNLLADVFVSGTNAVTMDGKIVNIDGVGNRVTGMVFGVPKVILVIGRNKIVRDADEAIRRIKNTIAPAWGKLKGSVLPCVKTGRCHDCNARRPSRRRCNVTTIMEGRPLFADISVILVDEDLGLGWDPGWPPERINKIKGNCVQHMVEGRFKAGQTFLNDIKGAT